MAGTSNNPDEDKDKDPQISTSVSLISGAVASASSALTSAFSKAGQAVSGTATQIASGTIGVVNDVGGAVSGAVSAVGGAVTSLTASLGPVGAIIGGVASAVSTVTGTVMNVASAVASTVLSVGTAILGTVATIATTAVSVVSGVINTVSSVVSGLSGLFAGASAALGVVGAIAGAVAGAISGVVSVVGSIVGALTSVVSGIVSAVTSVVGALTSAFKSVSESVGALAGIAGQALGGFISAVQSSVEALLSFSRDVTSISNHTGMSLAAASNLTTDMRAIGISSGETAKMFGSLAMNPQLFNARSNATGLVSVTDPNFAVKEAAKFQALVKSIGRPAATARLNAQFGGQAPEAIVRMVNTDPRTLQKNLDYGRNVNEKMGVGTGEIKAASEDLPLLINRISMFIDAIKVRFAADLLPSLEAAFSVVSSLFESNAGSISSLLETATKAIFVDGPDLAANAANTVLDWTQAIVDAFFALAGAGLELVRSFMNRQGPIYGVLSTGATFIDSLVEFGAQFAGIFAYLRSIIKSALVTFISALPGGPGALLALGVDTRISNPRDAYDKAYNSIHKDKGVNDTLNGAIISNRKNALSAVDAGQDKLNKMQATSTAAFKAGHTMVDTAHAMLGSKEEREKTFENAKQDKLLEVQQQHLAVAKEHLGIAKGKDSAVRSPGQVLSRIGSYIAEDAYRLTSR